MNEVSASQQLARRDRHFLHAGKNPKRANAVQAPAPLGANLRTPATVKNGKNHFAVLPYEEFLAPRMFRFAFAPAFGRVIVVKVATE